MTITKRTAVALSITIGLISASCSGSDADVAADPDPQSLEAEPMQAIAVSARTTPNVDTHIAGSAITAFGSELFASARQGAGNENLSLSPTSIAVALAMLEPGTTGDAQTQIRALLRITDPAEFHASMNGLAQDLEARIPGDVSQDQDAGEVELRIANAAYLQHGYPFEPAYLDTIGSNYGPVLNEADFQSDPEAVAIEINDFIADATNDRITDLVGPGAISPDTVLALVNALYLNASWQSPFGEARTADAPFTMLDGTVIDVPLMTDRSNTSSRGDGWVGATKTLIGRLHVQFILPDEGRFDEIASDLGAVWEEWPELSTAGSLLSVPRFETRTTVQLDQTLQDLGLTATYQRGNLLGIADDHRLVVDKVLHETFVSIDEEGIEAAAATVLMMSTTSLPLGEPVPVVLDRPFLYRIVDDISGATLFIGQIVDPTS